MRRLIIITTITCAAALLPASAATAYHPPVSSTEGEAMSGSGYAVENVDDTVTSGGALRRMDDLGTAVADLTIDSPATNLVVWARGDQSCGGWPRFGVRLDGTFLGQFDADTMPWQPYSMPVDVGPGTHRLTITFLNPGGTAECARSLRIDHVDMRRNVWRPFSRDSLWNTPAAEQGTPVSNPHAGAAWLTYGSGLLVGGGPCGSSSWDYRYRKPIYFAQQGDPVTTNVTLTQPSWQPDNDLAWDGRPIPVPAGAAAAEGTDGHLTIVDADRGLAFEFWRATTVSQFGITAATLAVYPLDGPGYSAFAGENSARGSGMPVIGTTLRAEDAYYGMHHALGFVVPRVSSDYVMPPASKSDGSGGPMRYGELYVLRPDYPIAPDAPRGVRNVLDALKVYGAYVVDQGASWQLDSDSSGNPALWCQSGVTRTSFEDVKPSDLRLVP